MPITKSFAGLSMLGLGMMPFGDFESIATVTVGSGGAADIEFTSIPGTYQHLQVRGIYRNTSTNGGSSRGTHLRLNGDTGSNYARHALIGTGSAAAAEAESSINQIIWGSMTISTDLASTYTCAVADFLDYSDTSKNTTVRFFAGREHNGSGLVILSSGLWNSASAVTSLKLSPVADNFEQYSTFALYGIKA